MVYLLQNDIDVAGNELRNLFPFGGLHRVVAFQIITKILQRKNNLISVDENLTHHRYTTKLANTFDT